MLIRQMLKSDEMKLEPVLAVDDDEHKRNITITEGVKVQGEIADIPELVRKYKIKNHHCNSNYWSRAFERN